MPNPLAVRPFAFALMLATALSASASDAPEKNDGSEAFPQGVASGVTSSNSVLLWTRAPGAADLTLHVGTEASFLAPALTGARKLQVEVGADEDWTVRVPVGDLEPGTLYHYRFTALGGETAEGRFRTAPAADDSALLGMVVGGDLGGQGYCRRVDRGYSIFRSMLDLAPDLLIANGDMIYADGVCPARGPDGWVNIPGDFMSVAAPQMDWTNREQLLESFFGHWRYNRADPHHRNFLAAVPMLAQWDDHEVINDFGASWPQWLPNPRRPGYAELVRAGRDALFWWNPIPRGEDDRIYRSLRWGKEVEIFIVDSRSYRSYNDLVDRPSNAKTLLGEEQLEWLKDGLAKSDATWKIISNDVPLSIPTGSRSFLFGRDSFANGQRSDFSQRTGFESEQVQLLKFLDGQDIRNVVFVATDVHFAISLRYDIDMDGDGDSLLMHEFVSGPLSARSPPTPTQLDPSLQPAILYGEGGVHNYAYLRLVRGGDGAVHLIADVRDEEGQPRFGSRVELVPE
ncbi:MAG: alkaline phosphatase D family protein [Acidobacteriota bacterium]